MVSTHLDGSVGPSDDAVISQWVDIVGKRLGMFKKRLGPVGPFHFISSHSMLHLFPTVLNAFAIVLAPLVIPNASGLMAFWSVRSQIEHWKDQSKTSLDQNQYFRHGNIGIWIWISGTGCSGNQWLPINPLVNTFGP
ncbi:hypothetical protein OG21DRAFT_1525042 [Imleria badia]|nr:hypothetical protein OG21DRAFT_1525042 [Imleria badia]